MLGYEFLGNLSKGAKLAMRRSRCRKCGCTRRNGSALWYGTCGRRNMKKAREYGNRAVAQGSKDAKKQLQDIEEMYKNPSECLFNGKFAILEIVDEKAA